jgi:hypothetical protein
MKVRASRRDDVEFQMDEKYEFLLETCSFHCDHGYIHTTCNLLNFEIFSKFGYKQSQKVRLHRLIYHLYLGRKLEIDECVDHVNHDKLDNRIQNLRILSSSQNTKNHKLKDGQFYHNIYYNKYMNYFVFDHRDKSRKIRRTFRTLRRALDYFTQYDNENNNVLTKSIYNLKPIDEVENVVLEADAFCENCGGTFWNQFALKRHHKKCV